MSGIDSEQPVYAEDEDEVAEEFADGDAEKGNEHVGAGQAENDGDGTAEQREEGEESHPGTAARHEAFSLLHVLLLDFQVFLYPIQFAHAAHKVVEHRAQHVADGAIDDEEPGIEPRCQQAEHDGFAGKGKDAACQKGGHQHAPIAVVLQNVYEGIHRLRMVMVSISARTTKNTMLVIRVEVNTARWATNGHANRKASRMSGS